MKMTCWLGGRDSNPDTVVQSHVSYRWTTSQYQSRLLTTQELLILANPNLDRQAAAGAGTSRCGVRLAVGQCARSLSFSITSSSPDAVGSWFTGPPPSVD